MRISRNEEKEKKDETINDGFNSGRSRESSGRTGFAEKSLDAGRTF